MRGGSYIGPVLRRALGGLVSYCCCLDILNFFNQGHRIFIVVWASKSQEHLGGKQRHSSEHLIANQKSLGAFSHLCYVNAPIMGDSKLWVKFKEYGCIWDKGTGTIQIKHEPTSAHPAIYSRGHVQGVFCQR